MKQGAVAVLSALLLMTTACAQKPTDPEALKVYEENNDPLEPMNRAIWEFNMTLDRWVLKPVVKGYRAVTPQPVRTAVSNVYTNIRQPVHLGNALLQGEGKQAWEITKRFTINTLFGFFGAFDTAGKMDIPVHRNDFGQTLATWGWQESEPYLVLPILGPSNPRDAIGTGADLLASPAAWAFRAEPLYGYGVGAGGVVEAREATMDFTDSIERDSTDFYATTRSMIRQNRQRKISTGQSIQPDEKPDYDFDFEFEDEE